MLKIYLLYTGGTIGMLPKDRSDPKSPLAPVKWDIIEHYFTFPDGVDITFAEMPNIIDSSDVTPAYWADIARRIGDNYDNHDGFVILHGTDTLAYTASALSFMFENLAKPVILTGSQRTVTTRNTDAITNLANAISVAAECPQIHEVCVFFQKKLLRGNRTRKYSTFRVDGFKSYNYPRLVDIKTQVPYIRPTKFYKTSTSTEPFTIHDTFDTNVIILDIFPGIDCAFLKHIFDTNGLNGIVLRTYGAGNAPTTPEFLGTVEYAVRDKGIVVVNLTQCLEGRVEVGKYETGVALTELGVLNGAKLTPEAAVTKMMYLFGLRLGVDEVKVKMTENLRGEM
ncbi:MAG: type I asparaginase [Oscillospiraceae bacterium]|jgi:L-asparaginase|nr:type I asparaginase [Oscillospiraceae bacterium]